MTDTKKPKWEIGQAIQKGNEAIELTTKHQTEIGTRLQPNELTELTTNAAELERRRSGQTENLVDQKSKTRSQEQVMEELHVSIIDIRGMVTAVTSESDISISFGVGQRVSPRSMPSLVAAANLIINGYTANTEWANTKAGIIEDDITEITELMASVDTADDVQETAIFERKAKTLDKNTLQRGVEDLVTKISAVGAKVFRKSDPGIAKLFEDLIPKNAK